MFRIRLIISCIFFSLLLFGHSPVYSFGKNGHRIVAQIAENHLTPKVLQEIMLITNGRSLAQLSTWPDAIRSDKNWDRAKPWHYISIDDHETIENFKRSNRGDVLDALQRFESQLRNPEVKGEKRWQALAFYVHFIADIHQPLHVGRRDDRGGNNIAVKWFGKPSNLHRVWDTQLIEGQQLSYSEYVDFIDHANEEEIIKWQLATYLDYAKESKALRKQVYDFDEQSNGVINLGFNYSDNNINTLNQQLLKAGIRLAGRLNTIFEQ